MAKIYRNLIIKKIRTIDSIPGFLKVEVLSLLKMQGYDGYGNYI